MAVHKRQKISFQDNCRLMQVKSIAECWQHSAILSTFIKLYTLYFRSSLSCHLSFRPLFCLVLSGCLRQVLVYIWYNLKKLAIKGAYNIFRGYNGLPIFPLSWNILSALSSAYVLWKSILQTIWSQIKLLSEYFYIGFKARNPDAGVYEV